MSQQRSIDIAYPENQLTQRYLGSRALQGKELEFFLSDTESITGFVTGIDDDSFQVCTTPSLDAELLSTRHVIRVRETGKSLDDLRGSDGEDARRYTKIFRRVAERELTRDSD